MERTASCPSCHRGIFAEDVFCSWCGARVGDRTSGDGEARRALAARTLPTGDREVCGSCNGPILPGDVFCPACGARSASGDPAAVGELWAAIPRRVCDSSGGKYEFVRELGRGGMGIVFVARDRELERLVAIKVLSPAWLTDESMVERFRREARTIASLRHESIVTVYDEGRAGDLSYFVMDYIEGVSLSQILRTHGPLPIACVEALLYRVASALAYAHRPGRGIVHRDIKPSNIMVDSEGHAVVMDFGISKMSERPSGLTSTGLVMGTPEYMSPEQCRGHTVTHESDQYSLGAVMYALLTGAPPFTGPFYQVLMAHQTETVPGILERRPDCPPELAAAVERMLAKRPSDRWPGLRDAVKALGLRPLAPDDPALEELGRLVRMVADKPGSGRDTGTGSDTRRTPTSIRILPHPDELEVGDEVSLRATVLFADGVEEAGADISWESTHPNIARVDDATGQVVAVAAGSALITAVGGSLKESLAIQVVPPRVMELFVEPRQVELPVGSTLRLQAEPRDKRGGRLEGSVTWSSSNPRIVTVSDDGVVTARTDGSASVLAHCQGVGVSASVRVVPKEEEAPASGSRAVSHVDLSSPPDEVRVSETFRIAATPMDDQGRPLKRPVEWSVEDPGVLEHLGNGRFRAVGSGEGAVLAEADGARSRVRVYVLAAPPAPTESTAPGARSATSRPPAGASASDPGSPTPKSRTGAGALRALGGRGLYLGIAAAVILVIGGFWLVPRLLGPGEPPTVSELTLSTADGPVGTGGLRLVPGDTVVLQAAAADAEGAPLDRPVTWSSDLPSVAAVDPAGMLVALAGGVAHLTASSEGVRRDLTVTVDVPVAELVVRTGAGDPLAGPLELTEGESAALSASVLDVLGDSVADAPVRWTSSSASVATVDANGRVRATGSGRATLTAASGDVSGTVDVVVGAAPRPPPEPPPGPGTLRVTVNPWAYVFVDDQQRGNGRERDLPVTLRPGRHRVHLEIEGRILFDTTVVIQSGETVTIRKGGNDG